MSASARNGGNEVRRPRPWHGLWYFAVVIASAGVFAFIPFAHAARRLHRPALRWWAAAYGVAGVALIVMIMRSPTAAELRTAPGSADLGVITTLFLLTVVITGCAQLSVLRREVHGLPAPYTPRVREVPGSSESGTADPAVAAVLAARARRQEARELAVRDPLLARDLRIGRPDLPRAYDDGGLVDLNSVSAQVIAQFCEVRPVVADKIVAMRDQVGGVLSSLDELFVLVELPVSSWDRIRDRAVLLPD